MSSIKKARVLVIDDDEDFVRILEILLEDEYELITAKDGLAGFTKATKFLPDLIILDIMLPKLTGYQFCDLIQKIPQLKDVPILMLSAKTSSSEQAYGMKKGASAYLTKPIENSKLIEMIDNLLKLRPPVPKIRPSYVEILKDEILEQEKKKTKRENGKLELNSF